VATTCGTGGTKTNDAAGSFDCTFPDGPATPTVSAQATDSDGAAGNTATQNVTVTNVAPTVAFTSAPATANEGDTVHYTYSISDPGQDTVQSVATGCGSDGSLSNATNTDSGGSFDCKFLDGPDTSAVTVRATDSDGAAGNTVTQTVTVANVAPTVAFTAAPYSANEGQTKTYTYSISDPGVDTVNSVSVSCGSNGTLGASTNTDTSGSFNCTFPDGPATSTVTVKATDSDGASGNTDSKPVTVTDVAPTVAFTNAPTSANEGETKTYTYSISDPGQDTESVAVSCGANGNVSNASNTPTSGSFDCTFPDGPASSTVTATATDSDAATGNTASQSVAVANVAPTVTFTSAPATANEGETKTYTYSISDPGQDTVTSVATSCGLGGTKSNASNTNTSGSFDCTFPDGPATPTVSAQATDSDSSAGNTATQAVSVSNLPPSTPTLLTPADASSTNDNTPTFTWTGSTDPAGSNDTITYQIQAYNGTCGVGTAAINATTTSTSYTPTTSLADGTYCWRVQANDEDGGSSAFASRTLTVDAAPLTVTINQAATQTDPTSSQPVEFTVVFNKPVTGFSNSGVGMSGTAGGSASWISNVYDSGDHKTYSVKISGMSTSGTVVATVKAGVAQDAAGNLNAASTSTDNSVTWQSTAGNATPVVTITSPSFGAVYAKGAAAVNPLTLTAKFSDSDNGPWTWKVNWDDNGTTTSGTVSGTSATNSPFSATHAFLNPGVYTINVTVKDNLGAVGTASVWIVVFDPSGGYVTGGGWLNVGPGSYTADPTLSGRANFGFNSQYKKNALIPTGETEFNFQVGNMNFHSTAYNWLVVSGFKAQYKGTGTINGAGSYSFTLTAWDADLAAGNIPGDEFRILITDDNNHNAVVFDNRNGSPTDVDTANPQLIDGGSIVIHKA
jgi:Bacterial Ig-like domain/PKD domain